MSLKRCSSAVAIEAHCESPFLPSGKTVKTSASPLQNEFLSDFSIMNLGAGSSPGEEEAFEGVVKEGFEKEGEEDSMMAS